MRCLPVKRAVRNLPATPILLAILVWSLAGPVSPALAADALWRLTHGDQDALVVGKLIAVEEDEITLGSARSLAGLPVTAEICIKTPRPPTSWPLDSDLIASINHTGSDFVERWGIFLASSDDPATLTILDGPLAHGDQAAFQRYINSEGRDSEFTFIEGNVCARNADGSLELIYSLPNTPSLTTPTEEAASGEPVPGDASSQDAAPQDTPPAGWNLGYLAGAAAVLIVILILFRLRPRPPRRPTARPHFPDFPQDENEEVDV